MLVAPLKIKTPDSDVVGAASLDLMFLRLTELKLKGLSDCKRNWSNIDAIRKVFTSKATNTLSTTMTQKPLDHERRRGSNSSPRCNAFVLVFFPDYVQKNWKEDVFFGHQCLNGVNPRLIKRCFALPSNFPVTNDVVFLRGGSCLTEEIQVFITRLGILIDTEHMIERSFKLFDSEVVISILLVSGWLMQIEIKSS